MSESAFFSPAVAPAEEIIESNGHAAQEPEEPIKQIKLRSIWEMFDRKPPPPLVHELLDENTLTFFVGAEGTGKSFWSLALACAVATAHGMNAWEGRKIHKHGPVLYIAAEGADGMGNRIKVWCEANGIDPADLAGNLQFIDEALPLEDVEYQELLAQLVEGFKPILIIVDTKSALTASFDENDSSAQLMIIRYFKRLKELSGACVLVIHHTGKNGMYRGSSVWPQMADSFMTVVPDDEEYGPEEDRPFCVYCNKHKERPSRCTHEFLLKTVRWPDGKPRSRVIMQPQMAPGQESDRDKGVRHETAALQILLEAGPFTKREWVSLIREELGVNRATAGRVATRLIDRKSVTGDEKDPEKYHV